MSALASVLDASYTYITLGTGFALRLIRPTDADLRALGGDVLRGVTIGQQALRRAEAEAEASTSGMSPEEAARRASGRAKLTLEGLAMKLDTDADFREKVDSMASGYCAAAVTGIAVCPPDWPLGEVDVDRALILDWEDLTLTLTRGKADRAQSRVYVGDLLPLLYRVILSGIIRAQEVAPPIVRTFRGAPGGAPDDRPDGSEVRSAAE